jgi:Flp pilus assembly protein TadG
VVSRRGSSLRVRRQRGERGNIGLEFGLVILLALPMLFGVMGVGITLGRSVQAQQVNRDAGHMYAQSVDMTNTDSREIVTKIAQDFSLNATTGNAVLIMSQIITVYAADCSAAGVTTGNCTNLGYQVFTHRVTQGNTALRTSSFGTPPSNYVSSTGNVNAANYLTQASLRATNFNMITLNWTNIAYVTEGYFQQPDLNFFQPGFPQVNQGVYIRNIF